jgi:hypothetical protein
VTETFTNPATGQTMLNHGVFQDFYTRIDGTDELAHSVSGFDFKATSPGEGIVLQNVGRKVYAPDGEGVVFAAGRGNIAGGQASAAPPNSRRCIALPDAPPDGYGSNANGNGNPSGARARQ